MGVGTGLAAIVAAGSWISSAVLGFSGLNILMAVAELLRAAKYESLIREASRPARIRDEV
jgi:hypothetical protein